MPTTQSPYEIDRNQQRSIERQHGRIGKAIAVVRGMVEHALSRNLKAGPIEQQIRDYNSDADGFRARAWADRRDWLLLWVFWGTILIYTVLEFMSSGDISEKLAYQMAPHFDVDPTTGAMPIWLRRAAGVGFVSGMLVATLLVKLISGRSLHAFNTARSGLAAGEDERYRGLTWAIWGTYLAKFAYVAAVAGLYLWLFGYAAQRAAIMADLAADQSQIAEWSESGIKIDGGVVQTAESAPANQSSAPQDETTVRLAGATGVFYSIIVLLHACVLLLPADGFSRELELAHFKRAVAEKKIAALREEEHRSLRDIYEHVRIAPPQYQGDLVLASEPVHAAINDLYGRRVIGIAGIESAAPPAGGVPSGAPPQPSNPSGPNGNGDTHGINGNGREYQPASMNGSNGDHPADSENPVADWDTIFQSARHA